jgi:hypothetical protein
MSDPNQEIPKNVPEGFFTTELYEKLHRAGTQYDGHVTNGSLSSTYATVLAYLDDFCSSVKADLKAAGDFGRFDEPGTYGEYIAIEVLKKVREKYDPRIS